MSWIEIIDYEEADAKLKRIYNRVSGPDRYIDNVLLIHGLRPHSLIGHMTLYKNVLHHSGNTLPKWYLETIGVYVSYLNHCDYCVQHHFEGLRKLLNDDHEADEIMSAIQEQKLEEYFEPPFSLGVQYAFKLTNSPGQIQESEIQDLRLHGFNDGEILEINQVISYFNYVNRTVVGLGVTTEGDILGKSPGDNSDADNWVHK